MSENYSQLHPTYSLVFTTFPLLEQEDLELVNFFSIRLDKPPHVALNNQLGMVFVDLSYFKKDLRQVVDKKEEWCYFIKNAGRLSREELKILSTKGEDMAKAVGLFDDVSARDLEFLRKRTEERAHWDRISMQAEIRRESHAKGHAEGMEKGRTEGIEKGIEEGMEKGKAEGMQEEKQTVALNMLKSGFDTAVTAKMTGLPVDEIDKLKNGSN